MVAAVAAGDYRTAVQLLMRHYGAAIYSFCCKNMRDPALAEDVLQDTFTQAYRDLGSWGQRSSLKSWVFSIASHRCLDAIKARKRREARFGSADALSVASSEPDAATQLAGHERARALEACLDRLAPEIKMAVLLRYQEEMPYEEIRDKIHEKADTLRARVVRALPALRRCLEGKGIQL
jgi:RNA polymerase sigma-70 factor (ECF subfamily)